MSENETNESTQAPVAPTTETAPKAPKVVKEPKPKQPSANGVSRPRDGTVTSRIWIVCDELKGLCGVDENPARSKVMEICEAEGINKSTVATQFGKWRRFHGLTTPRAAKVAEEAGTEEAAVIEDAPEAPEVPAAPVA
jgi:hypothetical protein|tara:strand:+ start:1350 stop:1763 length:414 start_codon:yes stop_codon:yes gene_type:complete